MSNSREHKIDLGDGREMAVILPENVTEEELKKFILHLWEQATDYDPQSQGQKEMMLSMLLMKPAEVGEF